MSDSSRPNSPSLSDTSIATDGTGPRPVIGPGPSTANMDTFVYQKPSKRKRREQLDQFYLLSLVTGDVPFNWRENYFAKQMFEELDPSWSPPAQKALRKELHIKSTSSPMYLS